MNIHYQKTSCMTIGTRQRLDGIAHLDIKADNINIRSVSNHKSLGLHIDENLNRNTHIDSLCKVAEKSSEDNTQSRLQYSSCLMFQELDRLSVRSRIKYNKDVGIYKALNNMTPDNITKLLIPMSQTHSLSLKIRTKWYFI